MIRRCFCAASVQQNPVSFVAIAPLARDDVTQAEAPWILLSFALASIR